MFLKNIGDRAAANLEAQITQRVQNFCVTPTQILLGHAQNERSDFILDSRTAWAADGQSSTSGPLTRGASATGIRCDERFELAKKFAANGLGSYRQAAALGVGELNLSISKFGFQQTIFCLQIVDDLLLLAIEPQCQGSNQVLKWKYGSNHATKYTASRAAAVTTSTFHPAPGSFEYLDSTRGIGDHFLRRSHLLPQYFPIVI